MDAPKANFYWAVVGDAKPEPVAVVVENGRRVAYTCGCADPFEVDGPDARIALQDESGRVESEGISEMDVPPTPVERAAERARREEALERDRKRGVSHGHRRFNP